MMWLSGYNVPDRQGGRWKDYGMSFQSFCWTLDRRGPCPDQTGAETDARSSQSHRDQEPCTREHTARNEKKKGWEINKYLKLSVPPNQPPKYYCNIQKANFAFFKIDWKLITDLLVKTLALPTFEINFSTFITMCL